MRAQKLLIATTVPETLATILRNQPRFLASALSTVSVELLTSPGSESPQITDTEGLPLHHVPMARGISPFKDFLSLCATIRLLWRLKPTIVHSYTPKAGLVAMLAAWLCRVPVRIHTFTGLIFPTQTGFKQRLLIWTDRLICACATQVVPESQGVKHDLRRFAITRKPLALIGHGNIAGVDTSHFDRETDDIAEQSGELAGRLQLSGDEFVFCYVGRLNRDKGITELLNAFDTLPRQARLIMVGVLDVTSPIGEQELSVIERHERIHALGFFADIRPALHLADVLVLPSYREGFPNVVLQAGAMELPVIATDVNGSNEAIEPGVNGWLVPARCTVALHEAMRAAMETPADLRRQMGERARQRIQQRFEQKQHWQNMVDFYTKALPPLDEDTTVVLQRSCGK